MDEFRNISYRGMGPTVFLGHDAAKGLFLQHRR
jgi:hypothetical protein